MIINSDQADKIFQSLGENPHPQALMEFSQSELGITAPTVLDLNTRYPHVVTLCNYECQDEFYNEIETQGTRGYAPDRPVHCVDRMSVCRSTVYDLTPIEAARLEQDPRVLAVEPDPELLGHRVQPLGFEFSNGWDKSSSITNNMKNWGLLRCWNRAQIPNWGSDGTPNQTAGITTTSSGQNVDVVVFDGNILPGHPEYAVNSDGTGGSRVNQFNWWSLNQEVAGVPPGTYDYSAGSVGNNGHGIHVAGIMAGNTCGWAQDANIYNISPYGEQTNGSTTPSLTQLVNYIRVWHRQKTINPATGRRNPTVVNMSFGSLGNFFPKGGSPTAILYSNQLRYRGVISNHPASPPSGQTSLQIAYNGNWTVQQWYNAGVQMFKEYIDLYGVILYFYTNQDAAAQAAILDGAQEGIIWCAAGGNNFNEAGHVNTNADFENYLNLAFATFGSTVLYTPKFHNQMPVPAAAQRNSFGSSNYEQICVVGNIGPTVNQQLSITSQAGTKINMWAPGENIMSAYNSGVSDPRNPSFFLNKLTGTSMASPQVAGILACVAEQYPNMTQAEAIQYIVNFCEQGIVPDLGIPLPPGPVSYFGLRGASNQFLNYYQDRPILGNAWPQKRSWIRPATGTVYPRTNQQYRPIFVPPVELLPIEYLVVGGGGGAGSGGGGAGGFITESNYLIRADFSYTVNVGVGGRKAGAQSFDPPTSGSPSTFGPITAAGGGLGGGNSGDRTYRARSGGSGGGGAGNGFGADMADAGLGVPSQGNNGGIGLFSQSPNFQALGSGGGGGAGGPGGAGNDARAGDGGLARASNITGTTVYYCGGGGGASYAEPGRNFPNGLGGGTSNAAQKGGGGDAGRFSAVAGSPNTGGGGGGGGDTPASGAPGGSGVVILKYPDNYSAVVSPSLGSTSTRVPGYKIITFTAGSGTVMFSQTPPGSFEAQVELIGGGGGGGGGADLWEYYAGGGGGGGYLYRELALLPNTSYSISIGVGGPGGPANHDGTSSGFGQNGVDTTGFDLTSLGGGGGTHENGLNGASGGGAGGSFFGTTGGSALQLPGNPGGNGVRAPGPGELGGGGGGGGAGSAGANFSGASSAAGGTGRTSLIDGVVRCAGGRAGGSRLNAAANTGNGGSGGTHTRGTGQPMLAGGNGGSGILLVKYPNNYSITNISGNLISTTSTAVAGFKITTFTSGTGTIEFRE
jgi:hypothetical protein